MVAAQGALMNFWAHVDGYKSHSCFEVGDVVVPNEDWLEKQCNSSD